MQKNLYKGNDKTSPNFVVTKENVMGTTRYDKDYNYNKDIQGSTTSVVGQDGSSPVAYDYDDFGVTRSIGGSTFFNEICYTGAIYDVSTGLYYLNARYYDPKKGRFITRDTYRGGIDEPNTLHLYVYCANNPIRYIEPSGHIRKVPKQGTYYTTGGPDDFRFSVKTTRKKYKKKYKIYCRSRNKKYYRREKTWYKDNWNSGNTRKLYNALKAANKNIENRQSALSPSVSIEEVFYRIGVLRFLLLLFMG